MVIRRAITLIIALTALAINAAAQYYSASDTTYLYPNYGTYYHDRFQGRKTTSGEVFDQNLFTAAHWKLPFGTFVLVTNHNTNREIIVKINDRCPKRGVLDMTHRAATALGIRGCQKVVVRVLPPTEAYRKRWEQQLTQYDTVAVTTSGRQATTHPTPSPKAKPTAKTDSTYTIILGIASSHAQAFNLVQHLPERYRDNISIDPQPDDTHLQMTLSIRTSHTEAEEILRTLRRSFPSAALKP